MVCVCVFFSVIWPNSVKAIYTAKMDWIKGKEGQQNRKKGTENGNWTHKKCQTRLFKWASKEEKWMFLLEQTNIYRSINLNRNETKPRSILQCVTILCVWRLSLLIIISISFVSLQTNFNFPSTHWLIFKAIQKNHDIS